MNYNYFLLINLNTFLITYIIDMFSRTSGKAIAVIKQEGFDNKLLYVKEDSPNNNDIKIDLDSVDDNFYKSVTGCKTPNKLMTAVEMAKLNYYLQNDIAPFEDDFKKIYEIKRNQLLDRTKYDIILPYGQTFEIMPPINSTIRFVISGMTGSGKSTQASKFIQKYHSMYPNNKVFMFSQHLSDPVYDALSYITRVDISPDKIVDKKLDILFLRDSLVIFDDVDKLQDIKVSKAIFALIGDINANGRHYDISSICLLHKICDGAKTKHLLSDIGGCMLFLNGTKYGANYFLKHYAGIDQKQIKSITGLKSRWFYISLEFPQYVLSEHNAFILK